MCTSVVDSIDVIVTGPGWVRLSRRRFVPWRRCARNMTLLQEASEPNWKAEATTRLNWNPAGPAGPSVKRLCEQRHGTFHIDSRPGWLAGWRANNQPTVGFASGIRLRETIKLPFLQLSYLAKRAPRAQSARSGREAPEQSEVSYA